MTSRPLSLWNRVAFFLGWTGTAGIGLTSLTLPIPDPPGLYLTWASMALAMVGASMLFASVFRDLGRGRR